MSLNMNDSTMQTLCQERDEAIRLLRLTCERVCDVPVNKQSSELADISIGIEMAFTELYNEKETLRLAIKAHHDTIEDDRCILDDNALYAAAGLEPADTRIGDPCKMLVRCARFVQNRCTPGQGDWQSREELERKIAELTEVKRRFKNFHRSLCERFNCEHDEVDWQRDLLSLEEWIAKKVAKTDSAKDWKVVKDAFTLGVRVAPNDHVTDALNRLHKWIEQYGEHKNKKFIDDLVLVVNALLPGEFSQPTKRSEVQ